MPRMCLSVCHQPELCCDTLMVQSAIACRNIYLFASKRRTQGPIPSFVIALQFQARPGKRPQDSCCVTLAPDVRRVEGRDDNAKATMLHAVSHRDDRNDESCLSCEDVAALIAPNQ